MPLTVACSDYDTNYIEIHPDTLRYCFGSVAVTGDNNYIKIGRSTLGHELRISLHGGARVCIGDDCVFNGLEIVSFAECRITIGDGVGFNGLSRMHAHESGNITVGSGSLIADGCNFSTSHVHKIIDLNSGERINPPGDIVLEDRVWCAKMVSFWPRSHVGRECIVGSNTVISNKSFPANCVIAGSPPRIVRDGVTWQP